MNASEAIKRIQEALDEAEKTGLTAIPVENLRNYLAQLASAATTDSEADSNRFEAWKTQFAAEAAHSVEMFKSVVEAGQTALKSAILINGGAAGILFSFAASAMAKWDIKPGTPILTEIGHALLAFMVGVGAAGTATGFR
jgi:fructose-1,6-bisphosphatase/inositol monophosphatase family enzyme